MPITGLPNPQIHRLCKRCRQWFDHHEGSLCWPPRTGLLSLVHGTLSESLDQEKEMKYYCEACQALNTKETVRFRKQTIQGILVALVVGAVLILGWLIGIDQYLLGMARR